ncbi:MAG: thiamine pyrophosphate-dependent dehydrogenase E1 component subunit alpha [Desulfocurvibacter africanus]
MPTSRPGDEIRRQMFASMILVRAFENRLSKLVADKEDVLGMQILATGQEAASVASVQALTPEDVIVSNHRSHGHLLARNADIKAIMAEIMGKATGVNKGKSGTLHLIVPEVNALMTSTVVGAGPSMAAGAAFAQQYRGERAITAVFFGDGAAAEGNVHEAMNLAGVWKLPLLFICENNCWAGAQALKEHCAVGNIAVRASSYGMPGKLVDGNDADEVHSAVSELAEHCRSGKGPALLEAYTYRMRGHGEHDHQHYVDKEELELWAAKDPIRIYRARLVQEGLLTEEDVRVMERDASVRVEEAVRFAAESPFPAPEAAVEDVWVQSPWAGS